MPTGYPLSGTNPSKQTNPKTMSEESQELGPLIVIQNMTINISEKSSSPSLSDLIQIGTTALSNNIEPVASKRKWVRKKTSHPPLSKEKLVENQLVPLLKEKTRGRPRKESKKLEGNEKSSTIESSMVEETKKS